MLSFTVCAYRTVVAPWVAGPYLAGRTARLPSLQDGNMTGFVGECFHVFNKHASSAEVKPYFETEEVKFLVSPVLDTKAF